MLTRIDLKTIIKAPIEICFDLSRSIDLHQHSTQQTQEKAIAGRTTGLIGLNEFVTWRATHFLITQKLTSKITVFNRPYSFTDVMIEGAFKSIHHDHVFESSGDRTLMTDHFSYEVPGGVIGSLFNTIILKHYMKRLLVKRNEVIKTTAESNEWKRFLA
ncbi:MAG TPA: SRPBCC family protein [Cyclobacteriaceae bacterium]|nr:SRPBCC family protein [Cyclobacteriaceae bacterium]